MAGRDSASDFEFEFRDDAFELVGSEHTIVLSATIRIQSAKRRFATPRMKNLDFWWISARCGACRAQGCLRAGQREALAAPRAAQMAAALRARPLPSLAAALPLPWALLSSRVCLWPAIGSALSAAVAGLCALSSR